MKNRNIRNTLCMLLSAVLMITALSAGSFAVSASADSEPPALPEGGMPGEPPDGMGNPPDGMGAPWLRRPQRHRRRRREAPPGILNRACALL